MLDPNEVGGTALLGISRPVVKAHGSANAAAFCNAVRQTIAVAESGIIADITQNVDKMKVTPEMAAPIMAKAAMYHGVRRLPVKKPALSARRPEAHATAKRTAI